MRARLRSIVAFAALTLTAGIEVGLAQPSLTVPEVVRDRIAAEGRARVIVELAATSPAPVGGRSAEQIRRQRTEIETQRRRLRLQLGQGGHRFIREFADAPFVALEIDASTLAELESTGSSAVRVFEDRLLAPTLTQSVPLIEANLAHQAGLNGSGTVIAVVDSGVDRTHAFLAPRVVAEACFASAEAGPGGDCPNGEATQIGPGAAETCAFAPLACSHGTHVAGITAGSGPEFSGVAPAAGLIAVQVFHASTECFLLLEEFPCPRAYESDIVAGLEYVLSLSDQHNIAAINMSLGGTAYDSACDAESPLFSAIINNLKSVGIATIAASGNEGLTDGIAEPACIGAAISVGATTDEDEVAWFSNASADLDLLAPGEGINSSVPGGDFAELDGTSMAAPHVAGAWAIFKQAHPNATVDEALASFISTGIPIADARGGPTKPRIRVGAAVGIESPAPVIDSISPSTVNAFGPPFTLRVNGSGFVGPSKVSLNGTPQRTTYVDDTTLTVSVASAQIPTSGAPVSVTVSTPPPGGGLSNAVTLNVLVPALEVDSTSVYAGDPVRLTLINPPGGAEDWLGLAAVGSASTDYLAFVGFANVPSGTSWTVDMPQTPGNYEFRLFLNYGYTQAAVSAAVTVIAAPEPEPEPEPEPAPVATLTPSATNAAPGAAVTVTLANAPGGSSDWLALAAVGSPNTSYVAFVGFAGAPSGTWTVNMPQTPGAYEFRLFLNYGYTRAATSATVTVTAAEPEPEPEPAPAATLTVSAASAAPGAPVTLTLANGPGGATDWLALAAVGSPNTSYVAFVGFAGSPSGTWTVNMPQTPGAYEFRLFLNYGYTRAATSAAVTVAAAEPEPEPEPEPAPVATLTVSTAIAAPGAPVTLTLANGPGGATDWLALAAVGSPKTSYVAFVGFAGSPSGTWTVGMPQTPGAYEFRLFLNYGYTQAAVSAPVTVQ
jgi:subtilisin family serine protease